MAEIHRQSIPQHSEDSSDSSCDEREPLQSTPAPSYRDCYGAKMDIMEGSQQFPDYQNFDIDIQQQHTGHDSLNTRYRLNRNQGPGIIHKPVRNGSGYSSGRTVRIGGNDYPSNRLPSTTRLHVGSKSPSASSQSEMSYPELLEPYSKLSDHGTPPPAPAPSVPDYPPRASSFHHPGLLALNQHRAAALVIKSENDEPPTYEVIPYSTAKNQVTSSGAWNFLSTERNLPSYSSGTMLRGMPENGPPTVSNTIPHAMSANHVLTPVPGDPSGRLVMTLLPQSQGQVQGHDPIASHSSSSSHSARYTPAGHNSRQALTTLRPSWLRGDGGSPSSAGCGKSCATPQCSWRLLAIGLLLMCGLLAAALAYITVSSIGPVPPAEEKCVIVEAGDIVSIGEENGVVKNPSHGRSPGRNGPLSPVVSSGSGDNNQLSPDPDYSGIPLSPDSSDETELPPPSSGPRGQSSSVSGAEELETDGRSYQLSIDPSSLWIGYARISGNLALKMALQIPRSAPFALYGRRNVAPSITQHDFSEFLQDSNGHNLEIFGESRVRRSLNGTVSTYNVTLVKAVEPGRWFLAVYNDDVVSHRVTISLTLTNEVTTPCPEDCNGRGTCLNGKCICKEGFSGSDCSISVCPVLCSGRGVYGGGRCHCETGWTGLECDVPQTERDSSTDNCPLPCRPNGKCVNGKCLCSPNFTGISCETEISSCSTNCGAHGYCSNNTCVCQNGWTGKFCQVMSTSCDGRCYRHGQCINGTCVCSRGFYGKHCTLEGCPDSCGSRLGRGTCVQNSDSTYSCQCSPDWTGPDCSVMLELDCNDDKDNDGDGLTDCADSECCSVPACTGHLMCLASADPAEVAARKSAAPSSTTFYQKVKFLIEDNAVQSYAHKDEYIDRRVSVLRGRVVSPQALGIVGVRVSVERHQRLGFTLTRQGGWFDILVNGGGAVTLQFQRNPFKPEMRTILVPWNRIVVLENIVLKLGDEGPLTASLRSSAFPELEEIPTVNSSCNTEELELLLPEIVGNKFNFAGSRSNSTEIVLESQVLREFVPVHGLTETYLVYESSSSPSYLPRLHVKLIPGKSPPALSYVHLRVTVEGTLLEKTLEADDNLVFTFTWDRFNAYKQKVYGTAQVLLHVGYELSNCTQSIVWKTVVASLPGFSPEISGIADFNVDIAYHYLVPHNILYGGNGQIIDFGRLERNMAVMLGTGAPRSLLCGECQTSMPAEGAKILNPVAMATAGDGSLYVGDFNLIRRVTGEGRIFTVLQLPMGQVSHSYYLAVSPVDGSVYVSDCERKQLLRILNVNEDQLSVTNLESNFEVIAGNGAPCLPGDSQHCGDGGPALDAKLAYPKGIAIGADRTIYVADGTSIRAVDPQGIIRSVVGSPGHPTAGLTSIPCEAPAHVDQIQPQWPTQLGLNPVDNSLHWIDNNVVVRLSASHYVQTVLGQAQHCKLKSDGPSRVGIIVSFAFGPDGSLYLAEKPNLKSTRLLQLDSQRRLTEVSFARVSQDSVAELESVSAVAVTPYGTLVVADSKQLKILAAEMARPSQDPSSGEFTITLQDSKEILMFNRNGQHIITKDPSSGNIKTTFSYTKSGANGKLMAIIDSRGNKVDFIRDSQDRVSAIETNGATRTRIVLNRNGNLLQINRSSGVYTLFDRDPDTDLIISRTQSNGLSSLYRYDTHGRIVSFILPSGQSVNIDTLGSVRATSNQGDQVLMSVNTSDGVTSIPQGKQLLSYAIQRNGSLQVHSEEVLVYQLDQRNGKFKEIVKNQMYRDGQWRDVFVERLWNLNRLNGHLEERSLEVNNARILTVELDGQTGSRTIYDGERQLIVTLNCDPQGHLKEVRPPSGFYSVQYNYDSNGRLQSRTWGQRQESYTYDSQGFLAQIRTKDENSGTLNFAYATSEMPSTVTLPSGRTFTYTYDESGALKSVTLPSGETQHSFAIEPSLGFYKMIYTPPGGSANNYSYVQHYDAWNRLTFVMLPGEAGRTVYQYDNQSLVREVSSDRRIEYTRTEDGVLVVIHERDFELRTEKITKDQLIFEEKTEFASKTGLAGFKFVYDYDNELRLVSVKGRIGGQILGEMNLSYQSKTGALEHFGPFKISRLRLNETSYFDGTAVLSYVLTAHLDVAQTSLTIHNTEVYRMEINYDNRGRINQTRTYTRYVGHNKSYLNVKNLSYDADGQFVAVDAPESWKFAYDLNGNLAKLTYRGNSIVMKYDSYDRLLKFGEGTYQYDDAGHVIQNAREERFYWSASGLLMRVVKKGIFDVRYFYDEHKRLVARRDHHGNVTQFIYSNPQQMSQVTHIFSARDLRLTTLTYNDRGHLIYAQILRNRYYIASDQCGTPLVIFNQHGDMVRELIRSPFGLIVYDSNPYFYLPIDWCGGILDPATAHIHLKDNRIYDPLVGQWLNPQWSRAFRPYDPVSLNLYRMPRNDPINPNLQVFADDYQTWMNKLGYALNLASNRPTELEVIPQGQLGSIIPYPSPTMVTDTLLKFKSRLDSLDELPGFAGKCPQPDSYLLVGEKILFSSSKSPFGKGLFLSQNSQDRILVESSAQADPLVAEVLNSVFNNIKLMNLSIPAHSQDSFYFYKNDVRKMSEDLSALRRPGPLQYYSNLTAYDVPESPSKELRITLGHLNFIIVYGSDLLAESERLWRHAIRTAGRRAWLREQTILNRGGVASLPLTNSETERLSREGHVNSYRPEPQSGMWLCPQLADDPRAIRFRKRSGGNL